MTIAQRKTIITLIILGLLAAAWTLTFRVRAEFANRAVAITVDYDRINELATMQGVPVAEALAQMKQAGATHVAIREDTLGDLMDDGSLQISSPAGEIILKPNPVIQKRVVEQVTRRIKGVTNTDADSPTLTFPKTGGLNTLRMMGVGYCEAAVAAARNAGLKVVTRPFAELCSTPEAIAASMDAVQVAGSNIVIFAGQQVWGTLELIDDAAEEMQRRDLKFGFVEMAKQYGDARLASKLKCEIIRCHAVIAAEQVKLPPQRAVDRFELAVEERSVRLCYIRPYDLGIENPLAAAQEHVREITSVIRKGGYTPGEPHAFNHVSVNRIALTLMLLAVSAATLWFITGIFGLSARVFNKLLLLFAVLCLGISFAAQGIAQDLCALGAAVIFPTLALSLIQLREPGGRPSMKYAIGAFIGISLFSLAGGILLAASISDLSHMMQIAAFRGVKLAQLLPLLIILILFVCRCTRSYEEVRTEMGSKLPEWPALRAGFIETVQAVLRYWHVIAMMIALVIVAMMLMRSGNVTPVPPSEMELKVRAFLDQTLYVRPRTKEIMLGHPALLLALAFIFSGWRRGAWAGILLGAIGQISLVNTFGHIHTPLAITLIRVANGMWVGIAVGLLIWGGIYLVRKFILHKT